MDQTVPKYIQVENKIKEALSRREIVEKLPGERVLAKEFGFSYMTIRKAIENLVAEGLLYKIPTKGTYVTKRKKVRNKIKYIGYFLDSSIREGLSSPYYSLIFNALEKEAVKNDFSLVYFSDFSESNLLNNMKKIDGVIISHFPRVENIVQNLKKQIPVVAIDNSSSDKSIPSITIDNFNAVLDSVEYLCSLGHWQIGFMTGLEDSDVGKNRLAGYKSALQSRGIGENMNLVYRGDYSYRAGASGANYFLSLDNPPTAIMCANDSMAIGAISELSRKGLRVPDDISVVGFDDISVASQIIPPLTTVAAPIQEIAELSVSMLNSLIKGIAIENRHIALGAQLVVRKSSTNNINNLHTA